MILNNILRFKRANNLQKAYINFQINKNFCVQPSQEEQKERSISADLVCQEGSPLQNAFNYNEEWKLQEYIQYSHLEDKDDGSTVLYNAAKEFAYFKGFTQNDSMGAITQNMIDFRKQNDVKNLVIQEEIDQDFENPLPDEKPLESVNVPLDKEFIPDFIHTVSDYTHFTYYGQKFIILEYEIMALKEKHTDVMSSYYKYFYEWIPMTCIWTEINGKMQHLGHCDGQSQQEHIFFEQLFLKKKIFPKYMKAEYFFKNFTTTTKIKKSLLTEAFSEKKMNEHLVPGSVIKAYKNGFSEVGVYLNPQEVIIVNSTMKSKIQDLQLVQMFNKKFGKDQGVADEYYEENKRKEEMSARMQKNKAAIEALEEKTHFEERKREEKKKSFLDYFVKKDDSQKNASKRRLPQRRQRNLNKDQTSRFMGGLLKPFFVDQKVYKIVSLQSFSNQASEIRQTTFKVQFYTPEELKERMSYLNKKKPHLAQIYPSYQAYYLACGYKASPILSFGKVWNAYVFTSTTKKFMLFWLIFFGGLMMTEEYRNRFLKYGRKLQRKWTGTKIVLSNKSDNIGEAQSYFRSSQSSYAAKLKEAQHKAYERELEDLQTDQEIKSAVARKEKGIAEKLKQKLEQQRKSEN